MEFPKSVNITEVGPRDGFQSISEWIPTELKLEIIEGLIQSNFKKIEVTSFVSPKAIPQTKDAKEIVGTLLQKYQSNDVIFNALVPNLFGATAAYEAGLRDITYVISASVAHNKANVKRTREESFAELKEIKNQFPDLHINLAVGTTFGCPYEGDIPVKEINMMVQNGLDIGVSEISLADTIGIANPLQMYTLLTELKQNFSDVDFVLHLHDTRGMGLANVVMALQCGIHSFESALGGLGGCPFAPGAAGNIASEDLVNMLESMQINTGIVLPKLLETVKIVKEKIKPTLTSHMAYVDTCSKGVS
ncbi:hydroxymethylglutaryl-CoA lyase [Sulfurospirillum sp. 1612]|uniref:hydroxymethylglutaryl-CoA lyase n=1 Tax=Sulfurospirillum sp. 1612 TaxID=3094835 RepID=UPI002F95C9AF